MHQWYFQTVSVLSDKLPDLTNQHSINDTALISSFPEYGEQLEKGFGELISLCISPVNRVV